MLAPTLYKERRRTTTASEPANVVDDSTPIPPPPAPVYFGETRAPPEHEKSPFLDPEGIRPYSGSQFDGQCPQSISEEKRPMSDEKRQFADEKRPYPAAYGSTTYHVEDVNDHHKGAAAAVPVAAAAPTVEETRSIEEEWEPTEPEYYTAP